MSRKYVAEALGTAMLLAAVVGSGIMGERLSGGNAAIALLTNTIATGAALVAIILTVGSISGAHLNPAATMVFALQRGISWRVVPGYITAQVLGAVIGVVAAHGMFGLNLLETSRHSRTGVAQVFSECVATFGLISVILGCARTQRKAVPFAVGAYITGAYWFTASTSFANPAVTLARALTDTFAGISPEDVPGFIAAQLFGALLATLLWSWLLPVLAAKDAMHVKGESHG